PQVDPGAVAQLRELHLLFLVSPDAERALPPALVCRRGGELLADHAQREKLVTLQAQDRLEPLDVLVAEHAVAALRAPRREQTLVLEVPDLRDRDVRELLLEHPADGPDREHAACWRTSNGHRRRSSAARNMD